MNDTVRFLSVENGGEVKVVNEDGGALGEVRKILEAPDKGVMADGYVIVAVCGAPKDIALFEAQTHLYARLRMGSET